MIDLITIFHFFTHDFKHWALVSSQESGCTKCHILLVSSSQVQEHFLGLASSSRSLTSWCSFAEQNSLPGNLKMTFVFCVFCQTSPEGKLGISEGAMSAQQWVTECPSIPLEAFQGHDACSAMSSRTSLHPISDLPRPWCLLYIGCRISLHLFAGNADCKHLVRVELAGFCQWKVTIVVLSWGKSEEPHWMPETGQGQILRILLHHDQSQTEDHSLHILPCSMPWSLLCTITLIFWGHY